MPKPVEGAARLRRAASGAASLAARLAGQPRALLAAKIAFAAAIAWYLTPLLPFTADEYSYYGPLGVLVTMHPTVARSIRSGSEVVVGLGLGIGLGMVGVACIRAGVPGIVVLVVAIAVAILIGGIRRLGAGQDWVALAALFVLANGAQAEDFSWAYLVNTALGVVIGIAVNLLILPPLYLKRADEQLSRLRDQVSDSLVELADAVEAGEVGDALLHERPRALEVAAADVSAEVEEAEESGRINPRSRAHASQREANTERMAALERTAFLANDLADVIAHRRGYHGESAPVALRAPLGAAIRRVAELIAIPWNDSEAGDTLQAAVEAVEAYERAIESGPEGRIRDVADDAATALCLRRLIDVCRPFTRADAGARRIS